MSPQRCAAPATIALSLLTAFACSTGDRPSESERATQLADAYRGDSAALDSMAAHVREVADTIKTMGAVLLQARNLGERLQPVIDAAYQSAVAGAARRYADIPGIAASRIEQADLLGREVLDHGIVLLDSASKLLDKENPDFGAVDRLQHAQQVTLVVSKVAIGFRDFLLEEVVRLTTLGPPELRPVAFDTLAALHVRMQTGRTFQGLDSLLRVSYAKEGDRANRRRMAATMERLGIPRDGPSSKPPQ